MRTDLRHGSRSEAPGLGYYALYGTSYAAFLVVALLSRLAPRGGRRGARRSVFAEAAAAAGTVTPFAFMG